VNPDVLSMSKNPQPKESTSLGAHVVDFIQTLVVFAAIGTAIYFFIAQPHKVSGSSMVPNFHNGDYIITDKVSYKVGEPKRGDIIVFKNPRDESQDFIKRIIGVPGDKVKVQNGKVFVNGDQIPEPYLPNGLFTENRQYFTEGKEVTVEPGKFVVFGDNRPHSSDSREWGFITKEEIIGKVFLRYWPANQVGLIKGTPF
jgi:signal peptidase I